MHSHLNTHSREHAHAHTLSVSLDACAASEVRKTVAHSGQERTGGLCLGCVCVCIGACPAAAAVAPLVN